MNKVFFIILFLIALLATAIYFFLSAPPGMVQRADITRIIDGDTLELESGEILRLACIDAPEVNAPGAEEATLFLRDELRKQPLRIEYAPSKVDIYGRSLVFIYTDGETESINAALIKNGHAQLYLYNGIDTEHCRDRKDFTQLLTA